MSGKRRGTGIGKIVNDTLEAARAWAELNPAPPEKPKRQQPSPAKLHAKAAHLRDIANLLEKAGDIRGAKIRRQDADDLDRRGRQISKISTDQ